MPSRHLGPLFLLSVPVLGERERRCSSVKGHFYTKQLPCDKRQDIKVKVAAPARRVEQEEGQLAGQVR